MENKRKALPLIDVQEGKYDYKNKYILFNFCFTNESERREIENPANITVEFINVGLREMYDFYIDEIESKFFKSHGECYYVSPIVYQNKSVNINFKFREPLSLTYSGPENLETTIVSPLIFKCYFKDCYDNWYYQKLSINFMHSYDGQTVANHKGLNVEYQGYEILSKPIEIPKENLPWNNGKEVIRM